MVHVKFATQSDKNVANQRSPDYYTDFRNNAYYYEKVRSKYVKQKALHLMHCKIQRWQTNQHSKNPALVIIKIAPLRVLKSGLPKSPSQH